MRSGCGSVLWRSLSGEERVGFRRLVHQSPVLNSIRLWGYWSLSIDPQLGHVSELPGVLVHSTGSGPTLWRADVYVSESEFF